MNFVGKSFDFLGHLRLGAAVLPKSWFQNQCGIIMLTPGDTYGEFSLIEQPNS